VTPKEIAEAKKLVESGMFQKDVAKKFGVSKSVICRAVNPKAKATFEAYRRKQRPAKNSGKRTNSSIHFEQPMKAETKQYALLLLQQIPPDTRNFTALMMGDPLPGRSALDRRQT